MTTWILSGMDFSNLKKYSSSLWFWLSWVVINRSKDLLIWKTKKFPVHAVDDQVKMLIRKKNLPCNYGYYIDNPHISYEHCKAFEKINLYNVLVPHNWKRINRWHFHLQSFAQIQQKLHQCGSNFPKW